MTHPQSDDSEPWSRPAMGAIVSCLLALAVAVIVLVAADSGPGAAPPGSDVRIYNHSAYPFRQVVVNGMSYGNIGAGDFSEYRHLRVAYRYAGVRLIAGTREMQLEPEDYVGETPLGRGKFTYVLNITAADQLDLSVEKGSR